MMRIIAAALLLLVVLAGCGGGEGVTNIPLGSWTGTWQNIDLNQSGPAAATVTDGAVTGTLSNPGGGQSTFQYQTISTQVLLNQTTSCGLAQPFGYSETGPNAGHLLITFQCPGTGTYQIDLSQL